MKQILVFQRPVRRVRINVNVEMPKWRKYIAY